MPIRPLEPAGAVRRGRQLLDAHRRGRPLQIALEPQPVEPHEIGHGAALAIDEAVHQTDIRAPRIGYDPQRVVERAVALVDPAVRPGALDHHAERVLLFDHELGTRSLAGLVHAFVRPQQKIGAAQARKHRARDRSCAS